MPEHHGVARRLSVVGVRRGFGVMVGLDLDNDPPDAVDQQRHTDQIGGNLKHASVKKRFFELLTEFWAASSGIWGHGMVC